MPPGEGKAVRARLELFTSGSSTTTLAPPPVDKIARLERYTCRLSAEPRPVDDRRGMGQVEGAGTVAPFPAPITTGQARPSRGATACTLATRVLTHEVFLD